MKKIILVLIGSLILFNLLSAASNSKVSYRFWNALNSSFDEYPKPKNPPERVWGAFGTNFNELTFEQKLNSKLLVDLFYSTSTILENKMNIRNSSIGSQYGYIGGTNTTAAGNFYYRHFSKNKNYSDVFLGYQHKYTLKEFYDRNDLSDIGNYQAVFSGFSVGWRGQYFFTNKLGFKSKIAVQPQVHNKTWVNDPLGGSTSYVTKGSSKYLEVGFVYMPTAQWEYSLGHIYNTYCFEPVGDNYDLTIHYDGFFFEAAYLF